MPITIHALGRIGATRQTPAGIGALAGGVVSEIAARDGEAVSSGTLLLRLDPRASQAELQKARSDVALAKREWDYAKTSGLAQQQADVDLAARQAQIKAGQDARESARLNALLSKGLVSEKAATEARQTAESSRREYESAASKADAYRRAGKGLDLARLQAKVEEAKSALRLAELEADATTVRAPMAGRVTRVLVTAGQAVDKGVVLIELQGNQGIGARFSLAPPTAARVRPGMRFALRDEASSRSWQGTITAVGAGLDPDSGLAPVEGALDLKGTAPPFLGEILPGEIVTGESKPGLIAPASALSVNDEGSFVHLVDGQGKARLTRVTTLAQSGQEILLEGEGLKAGASVIIDGNYNLPDGAGVTSGGARTER